MQLSQHLVVCLFFSRILLPSSSLKPFHLFLYSSPCLFFIWGVRGIHSVWASGISIFIFISFCLPNPIFVFPLLCFTAFMSMLQRAAEEKKNYHLLLLTSSHFHLKTSGIFWFPFKLPPNTVGATDLTNQKQLMCLINGIYSFNSMLMKRKAMNVGLLKFLQLSNLKFWLREAFLMVWLKGHLRQNSPNIINLGRPSHSLRAAISLLY